MKPSLLSKLEILVERRDEIARELSQPEIANDSNRFRTLSQEYARSEELTTVFNAWQQAGKEIESLQAMAGEEDAELKEMAEMELPDVKKRREKLENELMSFLVPRDPEDDNNAFIEVRAGTGGDEAAIFAGDLFRMYSKYAESKGWRTEVISESLGEHGGYKEIIVRIEGAHAYGMLKFESGGHRVQRVPETETQGRIHTSAATVAVMPEVEEAQLIELNSSDLKVDTFRASGAGGQHVNKTDSAIRITHIPSGLVVECQDERSQHKNRARAMSLLQARLNNQEREKREAEEAATRKQLVGSGDRSERIRTYNFPQGRITDHRINLTLYQLDKVIQGGLDEVIGPLQAEHQAMLLAEAADSA